MGGERNASRHVAYDQVKTMIDFMGQNIEFAKGSLRTLEARHTSKKLWAELTKILNDCKGVKKSADGWSKYWSDFKNKLKNRALVIRKQKKGTFVRPLTKVEKRVLLILGPHFDKKLTGASDESEITDALLSGIKIEAYQDNNDICKTHNGEIERLSDSAEMSEDSEESNNEGCGDDSSVNLNDSLHNLYPKWLVKVEKKRADAELLRAKAEEKRASAAAKSADAALIQAVAMKKLAEAAEIQAAAIVKMASRMSNQGNLEEVASVSSTSVFMPRLNV